MVLERSLGSLLLLSFAAGCGSVTSPDPVLGAPAETVAVRVSSPTPVELWSDERVCRSPCARTIDVRNKEFQVRVPELPDSPKFEIPQTDRDVIVQVHPSHYELIGAGATLGVLGGGAIITGGGAALLDVAGRDDFQGALGPGLITAAAGGALLAGGIVCAVLSGTSVTMRELATLGSFRF
ncbi:MAG: hypothetical protein HOV80_12560 [Polyangiaceae bacterium]|nr:hypothetical protein [Polyangiaceae bacterium]